MNETSLLSRAEQFSRCVRNRRQRLAMHIGRLDPPVSRTKTLRQNAHVELILKKGYEAMTVQDICDTANVGRSTFYAHYTGKDDLRRKSFEHLRKLSS